MWRLEARPAPSRVWVWASPVLALALTTLLGMLLFAALGKDPAGLKAAPLLLMALGLALAFRSNVWNIGAEGQFVMGAVFAGGVALAADASAGGLTLPAMLLAGAAGGMCWAAIAALLRDKCHASEILVSLMLVYVAVQVLGYLVYGPWKDPQGYNFPQTRLFGPAAQLPRLMDGSRAGFAQQVCGLAPAAARYAGFSSRRALWTAMLASGGAAGLAGALEVAGPLRQLTPNVPAGYGFAAIIVAFVGRLHPLGIVLAALLMSMFYIGGELAQSRLGLPKSITGVFQGLLLFALLACDTLVHYRIRRGGR